MRVDQSLRRVLAACGGIAFLAGMDGAIKAVVAVYPLSEVVGLRYAVGALFSVLAFLVARERVPGWRGVRRNLLRAGLVVLTAATFFTAIARLPLAEAVALTFLAPLFLAVLGRVILKEPIQAATVYALALGLVGVVVIQSGQDMFAPRAADGLGIAAALACAFFYALSNVLVRRQSGSDSTVTIVTLTNLFALAIVSPTMLLQWQPPRAADAVVFAGVGVLGVAGQLCLAWAYAHAPTGRIGVLEFTAFVWAALVGFFFFGEVPTMRTLVGAATIAVACVASGWSRSRGS